MILYILMLKKYVVIFLFHIFLSPYIKTKSYSSGGNWRNCDTWGTQQPFIHTRYFQHIHKLWLHLYMTFYTKSWIRLVLLRKIKYFSLTHWVNQSLILGCNVQIIDYIIYTVCSSPQNILMPWLVQGIIGVMMRNK